MKADRVSFSKSGDRETFAPRRENSAGKEGERWSKGGKGGKRERETERQRDRERECSGRCVAAGRWRLPQGRTYGQLHRLTKIPPA